MKFRITLKDPDGFWDSVKEGVEDSLKPFMTELEEKEYQDLCEKRHQVIREKLSKWFEYNEYLTVEVDTEAMTCVVVEKGK